MKESCYVRYPVDTEVLSHTQLLPIAYRTRHLCAYFPGHYVAVVESTLAAARIEAGRDRSIALVDPNGP